MGIVELLTFLLLLQRMVHLLGGAAAMEFSMPQVQKRDDVVEQAEEESREERDAAKPREHESSVAGAGWRRGNPNNVVKSPE